MVSDDLEPILTQSEVKNLEVMSIEALHEYIEELKTEIARVEDAIKLKETARASADTFFKP